jgi:adenylosuccinate synthase
MTKIDVVLGLARGDEGKGKVCHALLETGDYTHCIRFAGGGNAGHTIYHEGEKFVTHLIPAGVFYEKTSIIGSGCVVNEDKLLKEIEYLETNGFKVKRHLKIAYNAHIVSNLHINLDKQDTSIGTTKTGNGPCYADKYARHGKRAEDCPRLEEYLVDMYEEFYQDKPDSIVLAEGAQGFFLDIDWGDYPFVTSSHCGIGGVLLNGFNHQHVRKVVGVAKAYETYVGLANFEPETDKKLFEKIRTLGQEFGATTGRPRQCDWLDLNELIKSIKMNGVDTVIINKNDILDQLGAWKAYYKLDLHSFSNSLEFRNFVRSTLEKETKVSNINFSDNPYNIM